MGARRLAVPRGERHGTRCGSGADGLVLPPDAAAAAAAERDEDDAADEEYDDDAASDDIDEGPAADYPGDPDGDAAGADEPGSGGPWSGAGDWEDEPTVAQQPPDSASLVAGLRVLSAEDRAVVVSRYYLGLSAAEIGEVLDVDAEDVDATAVSVLAALRRGAVGVGEADVDGSWLRERAERAGATRRRGGRLGDVLGRAARCARRYAELGAGGRRGGCPRPARRAGGSAGDRSRPSRGCRRRTGWRDHDGSPTPAPGLRPADPTAPHRGTRRAAACRNGRRPPRAAPGPADAPGVRDGEDRTRTTPRPSATRPSRRPGRRGPRQDASPTTPSPTPPTADVARAIRRGCQAQVGTTASARTAARAARRPSRGAPVEEPSDRKLGGVPTPRGQLANGGPTRRSPSIVCSSRRERRRAPPTPPG